MKVVLDLDALVLEGKLSADEAERLKGFASRDTNMLGSNIFLAFGIVAVVVGAGVFIPTVETAVVIGALLFCLGLGLTIGKVERWAVFAQIVMVIGALALFGGLTTLLGDSVWAKLALVVGLAGAAAAARSGLLASLAVFMFAAALMAGTDIWRPNSYLTYAIGSLCALVLGLYLVSLRLPIVYERLAVIAMRTAILMINVAFLVGSLFGDSYLGWSAWVFTVGWAVALVAFGTWAIFANRRWVVNTVAVFAAIHFFTQWFAYLGAQPLSILGGGLLLIGCGLGLAKFNNWVGAQREARAEPGTA